MPIKSLWQGVIVLALAPCMALAQAFSGVVSSTEEGNMEGVLMNAKLDVIVNSP
jgi:ACR3 family arsenite efflux pump ArsB